MFPKTSENLSRVSFPVQEKGVPVLFACLEKTTRDIVEVVSILCVGVCKCGWALTVEKVTLMSCVTFSFQPNLCGSRPPFCFPPSFPLSFAFPLVKRLRRSAAVTRNCGRAASFNLQYVATYCILFLQCCVILLGESRDRCLMFVWVSVLVSVFGVRDESNSD